VAYTRSRADVDIDLDKEPIGKGRTGARVPEATSGRRTKEVSEAVAHLGQAGAVQKRYADVFERDADEWKRSRPDRADASPGTTSRRT
jgi:aconitase A